MAILHNVWQKLARRKSKETAIRVPEQSPYELSLKEAPTSFTALHTTNDPYTPLWQLLSQRQIIEVKVEGSTRSFQTLILAIDVPRGLIWLDDLFPNQNLLEVGDKISLRHHKNGEQLVFCSPIVAWGSHFGASGLAVLLPDTVAYQPRRQDVRCNVSHAPSIGVKIRPIGHDISYANVQDLSLGGARLNIPGNILSQLRHGALIPLCELDLSDELNIRCSARIRAFRIVRLPHRYTQVSIEFTDMNVERKQQLQQFINNLAYLQHSATPQRELRSA